MLRRRLLAGGAGLLGLGSLGLAGCRSAAPAPDTGRLQRLGEARWAHRHSIESTTAGGLSGIDYDAAKGEYLLLSDDRSDLAPVRCYTARWRLPGDTAPEPTGVVQLQRPGGAPWPARRQAIAALPIPDPEALRLRPSAGTLLWTSEGDLARGFGPALYESARDGRFLREFALPPMFAPDPAQRRGPRDNLTFEGLALTLDDRSAWLAMENALVQDGPVPTTSAAGGPCRFTQIDLSTGRAMRQIAYVPDAIPLRPLVPGTYADNGVSEVLMLDAHRMLVLERAYAAGAGNSLRLYEIDTRAADDVLAIDTLAPGNHRPAAKTLVADFATLGLSRLDNTEGMCWGPPLPDGRRLLVVVSDDNFNPLQVTQFAAFAYTDRP
ncbi:esterase-like activity of phytase family protein [Variovorax sp. EBFNA2]|uniref:esterase-like activity of phytase family protein n=1 Tax=Variovorax sp. EBFNA2 TaxID=3342097 RepID=UPI0029C00547|nr:esterase-like activity of phytase family protein [Variovorax boronicumulans]WPG37486.1 esterase-like activity of phytase family protein [Variovorax boronicumulans]